VACVKLFIYSALLSFALVSVVQSDNGAPERQEQKITPRSITVEHNNEQLELYLTGLTVRRKFFLDIYTMTHYLEQQPTMTNASTPDSESQEKKIYRNILQNNSAKQISMVFMRKLSAQQIQKSLRSGLIKNSSEYEYLQILPQVEQFMQAIYSDVKRNDEFTIRWFSDGTVISLFQGKQISSIKDMKFAKTLWAIWFGDSSVVNRKALIGELLTSS
jgi:hypothetical protein